MRYARYRWTGKTREQGHLPACFGGNAKSLLLHAHGDFVPLEACQVASQNDYKEQGSVGFCVPADHGDDGQGCLADCGVWSVCNKQVCFRGGRSGVYS